MPSFLLLCLNLWRVKPAVTAEPDLVAEIVGNRPPSRIHSRPPSRMSSMYAPSLSSGRPARPRQGVRASYASGTAPPSSFHLPPRAPTPSGSEFGLGMQQSWQAQLHQQQQQNRRRANRMSNLSQASRGAPSTIQSEYRAATVRSVRERYERQGLTEHMKLTHAMDDWKKADDALGKPPANLRHAKSVSARSMPIPESPKAPAHRRGFSWRMLKGKSSETSSNNKGKGREHSSNTAAKPVPNAPPAPSTGRIPTG